MRKRILLGALLLLGVETSGLASSPERSAAELMDVVMWNREPIGGPSRLSTRTADRARTRISVAS
jgi:protein SCO1/2